MSKGVILLDFLLSFYRRFESHISLQFKCDSCLFRLQSFSGCRGPLQQLVLSV